MISLKTLLACPECHHSLQTKKNIYFCPICRKSYPLYHGIPLFAQSDNLSQVLKKSQSGYDFVHQKPWDKLNDGSIEIFSAFARGNRTLDIACGDGYVEQLSPETVGLDFSLTALLKAKKNGASNLVQATAENLPFKDDAFNLVICAGSLEHFADPQKAVSEMVRVSQIQILTVHKSVPGHDLFTSLFGVKHQPIERPIQLTQLKHMLKKADAHIVFQGVWTLPVNYGKVIKWLPELRFLPSSHFIISNKTK